MIVTNIAHLKNMNWE